MVMTESWQAALACIQSYGRRRHQVSVLCHPSESSPHAYSQFVTKRIPFDGWAGPRDERVKKLLSLLEYESVDLIIPISDEDAHLLALCKMHSPEINSIISPGLKNIELARERDKTADFCREHDITMPESYIVSNQEELKQALERIGFPAILKSSYSVGTRGVRIIRSDQDASKIGNFMNDGKALQVQKFIEGDFVGSSGFSWKGKLLGSFSFRVDYQFSMGGTPPYSFYESSKAPVKILEKIAQITEWTGGVDLDFIRDKQGDLYLLEINPRLSGTINLPLKMGLDLARYYEAALDESFDMLPPEPPSPDETILFISLADEIRLISNNPMKSFAQSTEYRRQFRFIESMFLDDASLTRNQMAQFLQIAWSGKCV